jgi:pilus assembly protein Flp/PilA
MYVFTLLNAPLREESGQDLIEYALIAALVALGAIASMGTLSNQISNEFNTIGNNFQALSSFSLRSQESGIPRVAPSGPRSFSAPISPTDYTSFEAAAEGLQPWLTL